MTGMTSGWRATLGASAGLLGAACGLAGFALVLIAPRGAAERAADPIWLSAALTGWLSLLLAPVFLFGLGAGVRQPSVPARTALVLAFVSSAAAATRYSGVLVDYAAFRVDPSFAVRLQDTQTSLAEALFLGVALVAAASWITVAMTIARDAGLSTSGRISVAVAGLGVMLPVPVTPLALLLASSALMRAHPREEKAGTRESLPRREGG